ncbi:sigma-70 family RNA polymerase sigma factor [Aggregatimonas sangjinii]|uniref:Sigma-70 family RNA polymerase sigma factor n=1 Tax=Aggregatimonas sangjinii TaxID=2583587 RepID=A0A5B7SPR7_9FLAO|nr:sigma-70 family RNA polymerase sigma factor [Aggregatimonas sangjinii]QCX00675.1 sigma-70 family RNA polymerase sigma factor [Aggregatimonas sangjinii]
MKNENICDLFLNQYESLKQHSYFICKDKEMSEDIVQETFLYMFSKYGEVDEKIKNKSGFLYKAIKYATYNELKKRRKTVDIADHNTGEDSLRNDFLLEDLITKSIAAIPERRREVFRLRRLRNLKVNEIAKIMDITPKTVENHITIALKALKKDFHLYDPNFSGQATG